MNEIIAVLLLLYIPPSVPGCFVRNIKDQCKTGPRLPSPDSSWLKSIHFSTDNYRPRPTMKRRGGSSYYCLLGVISREGNVLAILSLSPRQKLEIVFLLPVLCQTDLKNKFRKYSFSVSSCLTPVVEQNHFSLSKICLEHINQDGLRIPISQLISQCSSKPWLIQSSSPNLSVKKSIPSHKSLIQWSFPVKRVKCYLIECAVSYQREPSVHCKGRQDHLYQYSGSSETIKGSIQEESRILLDH